MSNARFARVPNIALPRTKMKQSFTHTTTFNFGNLIPIDCFEVLPGDSFNLTLSSMIRMSQPIAPLMDTIECDIHAFFIPMRLVFKDTESFFGANKTSAGYQKTEFRIPMAIANVGTGDLSQYLGKPIGSGYPVSVLKERCYLLTWSEWYRAQQVQDPFVMLDSDDTLDESDAPNAPAVVGHIGSAVYDLGSLYSADGAVPIMDVCKKLDYFTACTISPQYGEEVLLPLGSIAPVEVNVDYSSVTSDSLDITASNVQSPPSILDGNGYIAKVQAGESHHDVEWYADLSKASAASVNQIRYAFQLQKYLERANFGSRYFEVLANHYGVTSPDARLQRPEYLGGQHFYINVQQVLSTAGATTGSDTKLGQPGANSTTAHTGNLFSKGFVEFGYVLILASTRQASHKYSQGILREDSRATRFEFYSPEFANLGDQAVLNKEIMVTGTNDEKAFGYQEHWAEYRYRPDRVSGLMNPVATGALDFWTLADKYATRPSLDASFIVENRDNIKRALVTGNNGPDFIADFYFDYTTVREMPAYTIPGLIDHFGTR